MTVRRVIKLGGSLLEWEHWPQALSNWRTTNPADTDVLVVGGGKSVNGLRGLAARVQLDDSASHWLAIEFMSATALLVAIRLGVSVVHSSSELNQPGLFVANVTSLLGRDLIELPTGWSVTSDSIAAVLARQLQAELVLLKSVAAPKEASLVELARMGHVDEFFPQVAQEIEQLSMVNLRAL